MSRRIAVFVIGLLGASCSKIPSQTALRWNANMPGEQLRVLPKEPAELIKIANVKVKDPQSNTDIVRGEMTYENTPIEGTWFTIHKNLSGDVTYVTGAFTHDDFERLKPALDSFKLNQAKIAREFLRSRQDLKGIQILKQEVRLVPEAFHYTPYLVMTYLTPAETDVRQVYVNAQGRMRSTRTVAFEFVDGMATVFLDNPNDSSLSIQTLRQLVGDGTLTSRHLRVFSALNENAYSEDHFFRYTPDEKIFDQVQAYYGVDKAMQWIERELQVSLNKPLEVKVHLPGSAMFYYAGLIRLGDGDGESYRGIGRDASIVAHETAHAYVELLSGLSSEGEPGAYSEGFADFFAGSFREDPKLGSYAYLKGPYKRTLENTLKAWTDFKRNPHHNGQIIGGTFWDLRKALGAPTALKLAKVFLMKIGAGAGLKDFLPVMTEVIQSELPADQQQMAFDVLKARNWYGG